MQALRKGGRQRSAVRGNPAQICLRPLLRSAPIVRTATPSSSMLTFTTISCPQPQGSAHAGGITGAGRRSEQYHSPREGRGARREGPVHAGARGRVARANGRRILRADRAALYLALLGASKCLIRQRVVASAASVSCLNDSHPFALGLKWVGCRRGIGPSQAASPTVAPGTAAIVLAGWPLNIPAPYRILEHDGRGRSFRAPPQRRPARVGRRCVCAAS